MRKSSKNKNVKISQKEQYTIQQQFKQLKQKVKKLEYMIIKYSMTRYLAILDKNKQLRIELFSNPYDNRSVLTLNDIEGEPRIAMVVFSNGTSEISFLDRLYRTRIKISLSEDGNPSIKLYNAKGKVIYQIPPKNKFNEKK